MEWFWRVWGIFRVATLRLLAQRGLAIATLLGLLVAVALTMSIPLYADAVYYRIVQERSTGVTDGNNEESRPPFAFMFRYLGSARGVIDWEALQPVDAYLRESAPAQLGLPHQLTVRHFKTDNFQFYPPDEANYGNNRTNLAWVSFGIISDVTEHLRIVEGELAQPATADSGLVDVLVTTHLAETIGLQVGEVYTVFGQRKASDGQDFTLPVRIAGTWEAIDPEADFWFYDQNSFENMLLVPDATFTDVVVPQLREDVYLALWYLVMDGSAVRANNAGPLLSRIQVVERRAATLLEHTSLGVSPVGALVRYRDSYNVLTILLFSFSVPILGLTLAFIGLVVGLLVERQKNEIAMLRSRGATTPQVFGISLVEGLVLAVLALLLGAPLSQGIATIIGQTRSFLNFSAETDLPIRLTSLAAQLGLIAIGLAIAAQVGPTLGAARNTIITYKQDRARATRAPWWQRAYLDVLLLIPAAYGTYVMQQQGSLILPDAAGLEAGDPFRNPLLFLVPALGIFALTLTALRFVPPITRFLAWLLAFTGSVGVLLSLRQLARSPGFYTPPLILLVLTLSLSTFTASLAQTLDYHLYDQEYYHIGADITLTDFEWQQDNNISSLASIGESGTVEDEPPAWFFFPHTEYRQVGGVENVTRVGRYRAEITSGQGLQAATFMGVDRLVFPQVSYWRYDFAPSTLGQLMNALASTPDGVLVPRSFLDANTLLVGDTIRIVVDVYDEPVDMQLTIVGGFDYFPTWYANRQGPLLVTNLDYLFQQIGGEVPYEVWLKLNPQADVAQVEAGLEALNRQVFITGISPANILQAQARPERQGLFGVLSVGFMGAALLTVLGFMLYALFSFQRRFIELGILRAVGMSASGLAAFLFWELAFIVLIGLGMGTGLGALVSNLFIPYLQIGTGETALTPPFLVEIAWSAVFRIYGLFGLLFAAAFVILIVLLLRMKIFQALKLGETL